MKRNFQRVSALLASLLLLFFLGGVSIFAEELPEDFGALAEHLDEEERALLPDGFFSDEAESAGNAVSEMLTPKRIFSVVGTLLEHALTGALRLFATLCGLLVLSAVLETLRGSLGSSALSGAVRFCSVTAIFAAILSCQYGALSETQEMLGRLSSLMSAMIPITASVWAMGGNVTTASVGTGTMYAFLTVTQRLLGQTVIPVCSFCMAAALCQSISGETYLRGIASAVKRVYTFSLGLIMTLLVASLGAGTMLSAAADSTAARTAKLVSSNIIPTVGGSIGETLRTVAASVQYLKSVVGLGGIVLVALLVLPTLLSVLATRLAFLLASGLGEMLGCESEARLLSELGQVFGILVAVCAMSGVMFILALTIFAKSTVALA